MQDQSALAWMRKQAKELEPSIKDEENVSTCARIISNRLMNSVPKSLLDEADRRAGAVERENENLKDDAHKSKEWLEDAKEEAGYDNSESFDIVWKEVLAKAKS